MIENMKKFLSLLILCALGLTVFLVWSGQSQSEKALVMARQSCGLKKRQDGWQFVREKTLTGFDYNDLSPEETKKLVTASDNSAILAHRAALMDSRWISLADSISKINQSLRWISDRGYMTNEAATFVNESLINAHFTCRAIQEDSNS
jgi:hypothetical protein